MKTILFCCLLIASPVFAQASDAGYALSFSGSGTDVVIPHNDILNVNNVTIELWMYWTETDPAAVGFLIGKGYEQLEIHTGGGAGSGGLRFIPTTSVYYDTDPGAITLNQWHHVAFTYEPGAPPAHCYIDGVAATVHRGGMTETDIAITTTTTNLHLGRRSDNTFSYKGMIDEVRIWNTTRTGQQIADNMYQQLTGSEEGLVAYYRMTDGSGTTLTDNSGHLSPGTLVGGVQWIASTAPLPVELVSFMASASGNAVTLAWKTASEVDNYGFEVQREESTAWKTLGFVAGKGTTSVPQTYAFTDRPGSGRFRYRLRQIDRDGQSQYSPVALAEVQALPQAFALEQNFPNPFNGSTRIRFALPEAGRAKLTIHDVLGRVAAVLVDRVLEAGTHAVDWDASGLPSGVYISTLQSGHSTVSKSCILQK